MRTVSEAILFYSEINENALNVGCIQYNQSIEYLFIIYLDSITNLIIK